MMKNEKDPPPPEAPRGPAGDASAGTPGTPESGVRQRGEETDEDGEMGGEAPCQLHRFWDGDDAD